MNVAINDIPKTSSMCHQVPHRKVLFVLGTLWGENGITSHLLTLSKGLQKSGWEVAIASNLASSSDAAIDEASQAVMRFEQYGVHHFKVEFSQLKLSSQNVLGAIHSFQSFNKVLESFKPDVIHIHSLSIAPYVRLGAARWQIPIIATSHLEPAHQNAPSFLRVQLNRAVSRLWGDRFIAISREIKHFFETSLQVDPARVSLVYHGIDEEHFRPPSAEERRIARLEYGLGDYDRVICLVARLDPVKGHDILIKSLSLLKEQNFKITVLMAGKSYGDELSRVMKQAEEYQVSECIQHLGMVDTRNVLWASDMITLPSRREGFPLVILEGMLCGTIPIRTPAAGVFDQIQDGINGWIFPFDDSESLASRIRETFENSELKSRMSSEAISHSRSQFTLNQMIDKTIEIYNSEVGVRDS
jgi:glycosyltransferase involved in cell wall biosynthesis